MSTISAIESSVATRLQDDNVATMEDIYNLSPPIHHVIYKLFSAVLILVGIFGVLANFSIIVLFYKSPNVSTLGSLKNLVSGKL